MAQKKVTLLKATEFAHKNGYLFAVYHKEPDGNFHKIEDAIFEAPVDDNTEVMVKTTGVATDFNQFKTIGGEFLFKLHNNYNLPDVIQGKDAESCDCCHDDGFLLSYCDRGKDDKCYEIQKCDECQVFKYDADASIAFGEHYYKLLAKFQR